MSYFRIFVAGFLLSSAIHVYSDYDYESGILNATARYIRGNLNTNDLETFVDSSLIYIKSIQQPMTKLSTGNYNYLKEIITPPSFSNFYFGRGACGSYAAFYARVLNTAGYKSYPLQLLNKEGKINHIIVCCEYNGKRVVVDPLFNFSFRDSNNKLVDINEIKNNWHSYYKKTLPVNYPRIYSFENGWSFTNWNKYGVFSKNIRKLLVFLGGKKTIDNFSFRYYIFGYNRFISYACFTIGIALLISNFVYSCGKIKMTRRKKF